MSQSIIESKSKFSATSSALTSSSSSAFFGGASGPAKQKGGLIAFDFDETITSQHIYNLIMCANLQDAGIEAQWLVVKDVEPRGSAEEWVAAFEAMIADGHDLAILTYNRFRPIICRYMTEKIGLSQETFGKVFLDCWLPSDFKNGKNKHLDNAKKHFKRSQNDRNVILVEDSQQNLTIAANKLHPTLGSILAPKNWEDLGQESNAYVTAPHIAEVVKNSKILRQKIDDAEELTDGKVYSASRPLKEPPTCIGNCNIM